MRLLTDRARSRAELAEKLAGKGFAVEVGERVLDRLTEVGLVGDAAFAQQWVRSRHTYAGKGKKAIALELRRKGVDPADAEPALAGVTVEAETGRAAELVRRKLNSLPPDLDRDKAMRRLVGMLARRGYNQSTAYAVVKEELSAVDFAPTPGARASRTAGTSLPISAPPPGDDDTAGTSLPSSAPPPDDDEPSENHETEDSATASRTARGGGLTRARDTSRQRGSAAAPEDEHQSATDLVRRKLRTLPPNLERDKAIRRLVGMLARRGYSQSTAYTVVKAELSTRDYER